MIPLHDDNPTEIPPYLTLGLIVACALVFLWQLSLGENTDLAVYSLGAIPAVVLGHATLAPEISLLPPWTTVLTSMFLHGGWMHLLGNMLYLWIFGNNVEDAMGHVRFIVFYLLCGTAAVFAQALPNPESTVPMIGASGAISSVLGAYLMLFPHARVLVALPLGLVLYTVRLRAAWVLGFWFVLQLVSSLVTAEEEGGGVAWGAHLGGFIAGMLLVLVFRRRGIPLFAPARNDLPPDL
jgi:membrane associated rhomboid family serine protease